MRLAVVGGGINGLCAAWKLSEAGYRVTLFERGELLGETSTASSKLLHGGLRYLENGEFRLVREALRERNWWLEHVPEYTRWLALFLPIFRCGRRRPWQIRLGLTAYDWLSGGGRKHKRFPGAQARSALPELKGCGLQEVFVFYDGQMDERGLGLWVARQALQAGARILVHHEVDYVREDGSLQSNGCSEKFDGILNIAGPWADELNSCGRVATRHQLDLIRGSHLVLNRPCERGWLLEAPSDPRLFFVLPWQGKTLVGTTEVRQSIGEPICCTDEERAYLLGAYNHYFVERISERDIVGEFSGLRPLVRSSVDPSRVTREYAIERRGRVITVFGGKWTTARALARRLVKEVHNGFY